MLADPVAKKSYLSLRALVAVLFIGVAVGGCDQDAKLDVGEVEELEFHYDVADEYYCYTLASVASSTPNAIKHYKTMTTMLATRFCKPSFVDYYTCVSTNSVMSTDNHCVKPSPYPTQEEIRACADGVARYLIEVKATVDKRIMATTNITKKTYGAVCTSQSPDTSGLSTY